MNDMFGRRLIVDDEVVYAGYTGGRKRALVIGKVVLVREHSARIRRLYPEPERSSLEEHDIRKPETVYILNYGRQET